MWTSLKKVKELVKEHICVTHGHWTMVWGLTVGVGGGLRDRGAKGKKLGQL